MENNLLYKDYSIFTKVPHIYLNLNTTVTKNLNVDNTTNLNILNVNTYSTLSGQVISDNIFNNKNLIVNGETTLNNLTNINNTLYLNHTEDSSNKTSGTLIVNGGVGISKNAFIGGNTTIENNLNVFKSVNIDKNLNVSKSTNIQENLNVVNITSLYNLNVSTFSTLNGQLVSDNILNNQDLIVNGLTTLHDDVNLNNILQLNNTQDSTNINNGVLRVKGGVGISRNAFIGGNTTIENNLNVLKTTNIQENLNVLNNTTLNKLNVLNTANISQNLNVSEFTTLSKNLNILSNTITQQSNIVYKDIIGHNSLTISKDSQFKSNLTVYGNFAVLGETFNIVSDKTFVADPLIVFGMNQAQTYDNSYGGFVINHINNSNEDVYSGIVRKPLTDDFYLYKNIPSIEDEENSTLRNPNLDSLSTHLNYGNFYVNNININNTISNTLNNSSKITTYDLDVTNNVSVSNDVKISGNLIVSGNSAIVITNHFDINDPIFTISNNSPNYDRGMLVHNGKLEDSDPDLYSGLIRKDNDSNFYLLDNINNPLDQTVPTTYKSTLILKNINTSNTSHLNGLKISENNDTTNTNNLIATFPNNVTSEHIVFHKKTKFEKDLLIESDVSLDANLNISDTFILLNTNTFVSHGKAQLLGDTVIRGKIDISKSVIDCDHINIRSFFNNLGNMRTKELDADNIKIVDKLRFPIRNTVTSQDKDFPSVPTGYVIFNKTRKIYEGFDGSNWIPLGLSPGTDTPTATINNNLNVTLNLNCDNNLIRHNLEVADDALILGNVEIEKNIKVTKNISSSSAMIANKLEIKQTSLFIESVDIQDNTVIHKNLNVIQNINVSDKITSNNNTVLHNLIVPKHGDETSKLESVPGSIYYNSANNLYYGHNHQIWLPLGGINPYTDTTIDHNLNVSLNLNVEQNLNVANKITSNNNTVVHNLIVPTHGDETSKLESVPGSIYYNSANNLYYGHNHQIWLPLGGINPYTDTTIDHNLNVSLNLNVEQNLNVANKITSNNNTVVHNLIVPKHGDDTSKLESVAGSIYYNSANNLYYGHNHQIWLPLGGINPYSDTTINHNLNVVNKTKTNSLTVDGISQFNGYVYVDNKLSSKEFIVPSNPVNKSINDTGSLYINYNGAYSQLKLRLNNQDNVIPFNNNPIVQLNNATDLFQFYNVQYNQSIFGNRITGLNDPAFNSFTKFYTLKEYTFFQQTFLTNIEFYVSHSINNNGPPYTKLNITLEILRIRDLSEITTSYTFDNLDVASVSFRDISGGEYLKNDKIKLKLTLNTQNINGHEIFIKLHGHSKIHPNVDKLHILDTTDITDTVPSLLCNGGAKFEKSVSANSFSPFTGSHKANMITPTNYDSTYTYYHNSTNIFKPGLIVSVSNSTSIHINSSQFNIKITDKSVDKTVFGVIDSYLGNHEYYINSLGEGAIWVSNINGNISNGDYIMSSNILGHGCKQNDDILHNYTVAKCCSVIDWNSVNSYINYYSNKYKVALVACTYHCG